MQSGCALDPWAFSEKHEEAALKLAARFECRKDDPKETVKCLMNVSAAELVKSTAELTIDVCTHSKTMIFVQNVKDNTVC